MLRDSAYSFLEIRRTGATGVLYRSEQGAGYYTYRLVPRGDERCRVFDALPNAHDLRAYYGLMDRCLHWSVSATPTSQYEVSSGVDYYGNSEGRWPVELAWRRVVDRRSNSTIAESVAVYFFSWIGREIGIVSWKYDDLPDGTHIYFSIKEVLKSE
jgi:hypothetical protein